MSKPHILVATEKSHRLYKRSAHALARSNSLGYMVFWDSSQLDHVYLGDYHVMITISEDSYNILLDSLSKKLRKR